MRVHESAINNITQQGLAGMTMDENRFHEVVNQFLALPERIQTNDEDKENWAITFARPQPIAVNFGDNTFSITIRGTAYTNGDKSYPGMNVTALYKIEHGPGGIRAVRQGKLRIFPPGFVPESGQRLSARQQGLRTMLERRFDKYFDPELTPKNLVVTGRPGQQIELKLTRWDSGGGWMAMTWKQIAATTVPATLGKAPRPAPAPKVAPAKPK